MDWHQIWEIVAAPDNIPIVALLFLVLFYTWYGIRQGLANDQLAAELEADPQKAKTHHRKTFPFKPGWDREVHVWPYLMRIEFLAAIIVTLILMVWSITLDAPLEEPANPNLTMNPAKAPWYFLGLQEMLVYFDPWIAGGLMRTLIIIGLMVIPYVDANPLGNGYYTFRQRRVGGDEHHRHLHPRARLDVVLARAALGPQPAGVRGEPGHLRRGALQLDSGDPHHARQAPVRRRGGGRLLRGGRRPGAQGDDALRVQPQDPGPDEPAAIPDHPGLRHHDAGPAGENAAAAGLPHQVRLDHAVVQHFMAGTPKESASA